MRKRSVRACFVLGLVGSGLGWAAVGCSDVASGAGERTGAVASGLDGGPSPVLLNEISVNPPSTDNPYEFVEIACTPNMALTGWYFVSVEGDSAASGDAGNVTGTADMVVPLPAVCGSNGLVLIKAAGGGHVRMELATELVSDAQLDTSGGGLENGTNSFLVVYSPMNAITEGVDYDANDDGTLELPSGATIEDAIAYSDGGANDRVYGGVDLTQSGFTPKALTRKPGDFAPLSTSSWMGGDFATGGTSDSLTYDTTNVLAGTPAGLLLTPGGANVLPSSDGGTGEAGTGDGGAGDADPGDGAVGDASDAGTAGGDSGTDASGGDAGAVMVLVNEVNVNPPGTDNPYEFIELKCTPSASLAGYLVGSIEGEGVARDAGGLTSGTLDRLYNLQSVACGANGLVLLRAPSGHAAQQNQTTVVDWADLATTGGGLENGSNAFVVFHHTGTLPTVGVDYDANDDGTFDGLPNGVTLVDGISIVEASADHGYGASLPTTTFDIEAISRANGNDAPNSAGAWYGGDLVNSADGGANDPTSLTYNAVPGMVLPSTPAGAMLTPGAPNATGTPIGVADGGTVTDAGSAADAGRGDAGVVDAGAAADAGGPPRTSPIADAAIGATGTATVDGGNADPPAEPGCSCTVVGGESTDARGWLAVHALALGAALVHVRRRRRG